MSDSDMEKALKSYAYYPDTHKGTLKELIKIFELPSNQYDTSAFSDIEKRINFNITGDSNDSRGFKLFVEIFKAIRKFNNAPVFYNGSDDITNLILQFKETIR